ncbi:hypothetical protein G6F31_019488 [Rhizopus arrhizus]|nr:hypothetical protein G6F31_019488 [Rhizopus arrhizus]
MHALTLARYASHSAGTEGEVLAVGGVEAVGGACVVGAGVAAGGVEAGGVAVGAGVVAAAGGGAVSALVLQPARTPPAAARARLPRLVRGIVRVSSFRSCFLLGRAATPGTSPATRFALVLLDEP